MTGLRELAEVAQVVATRIRQDASNIGVDIRNPRLAMENHARDLDRLAEKLAAHPAEPAPVITDAAVDAAYKSLAGAFRTSPLDRKPLVRAALEAAFRAGAS